MTEVPFSPIAGSQPVALLPRVVNAPPWLRKDKDLHFKQAPIQTLKYVDDQLNMSKVNIRCSRLLVEEGEFFRIIKDKRTEDLLTFITNKAEEKGMVINEKKTGLLCVSAATSFKTRAEITLNGQTVMGAGSLKVLGLTIDADCSFRSHMSILKSKLRSNTWALSKLRKKGLDTGRLVKVYKCLIRPTVEYLAPVWGPMITAEQSAALERQKVQALKNIFGSQLSANKLRKLAEIDLLSTRRKEMSVSFAKKKPGKPEEPTLV